MVISSKPSKNRTIRRPPVRKVATIMLGRKYPLSKAKERENNKLQDLSLV